LIQLNIKFKPKNRKTIKNTVLTLIKWEVMTLIVNVITIQNEKIIIFFARVSIVISILNNCQLPVLVASKVLNVVCLVRLKIELHLKD
jgi:hypothetical protein